MYFSLTCLSLVLVVAAASKLRSRAALASFRSGLSAHGITNSHLQRALSWAVPAVELLAAGALLAGGPFGWLRFVPCLALLAGFVGLAATHLHPTTTAVPCRCFGFSGATHPLVHLVSNGLLLAVGLVGAFRATGTIALTAPTALLQVSLGIVAALAVIFTDPLLNALSTAPEHFGAGASQP